LQINVVLKSPVDATCYLQFDVQNDSGHVVLTQKQQIDKMSTSLVLRDLIPFTRYTCLAKITCGNDTDACKPTERAIQPYTFETAEGMC
jgi:hypothetical protein